MAKQARDGGVLPDDNHKLSSDTLMNIAEQMDSEGRTMDSLALRDLRLTIRMRSHAAKLYGGGDSGHDYFLSVLNYCRTILVKLPKEATNDYIIEPSSSSNNNQQNRFELFQGDVEDEEELEDDTEVFPASLPRPEPEPESLTLKDLMTSDERLDAILFVLSLDEIMAVVVDRYQSVLLNHQQNIAKDIHPSNIVGTLIEAAVATNMGIQQVQRLDIEMSLQYPHLTTPYRLLSVLVLPVITNKVASIMREHATKPIMEKEVSIFFGGCLECLFRHPSDPYNRWKFMVPEFCSKYEVDCHGTEELFRIVDVICSNTIYEVPTAVDYSLFDEMPGLFPSNRSHHSWFSTDMR